MRTTLILGTNLVLGAAALWYVLHRFGAPALRLLSGPPHVMFLVGFAVVAVGTFLAFTSRWWMLLADLDTPCGLRPLAAYRAAGQSLSSLIPSGKLGGDPVRAVLLARDQVPAANAIASVAVDRTLEIGAGAPFVLLYAALLLRWGVPGLEGVIVPVSLGATALAVGVLVVARRLRRGAGLVTSMARSTGLDRLPLVRGQMGVLAAAEDAARRLAEQPGRMALAFTVGITANLLVLLEYYLLLAAFGLPTTPLAAVAAAFASGATHALPVPAGVGVLEGGQMWLFSMLGYPPEVGLAVGLVARLRELVWVLPGLLYLLGRGIASWVALPRPA